MHSIHEFTRNHLSCQTEGDSEMTTPLLCMLEYVIYAYKICHLYVHTILLNFFLLL